MPNNTSSQCMPPCTIRVATEDDLPGMLEIHNEQIATSTAIFRDDPFDIVDRRKWMRETKNAGFPIFVAVPIPVSISSGSDSEDKSFAGNEKDDAKTQAQTKSETQSASVLGFAYYSTFRPRTGFRFTAELTLYIHASHRGSGLGTDLMQTLLSHARKQGNIHVLIASVTADNYGSIGFFKERFGFEVCGSMKEVGYKFGRWQDVVFLQLLLDGGPNEGVKN